MAIQYYERERVWKLDTKNTTYVIGEFDEEHFLGHIYYGKRLAAHDLGYVLGGQESGFLPSRNTKDRVNFMGTFAMEYPTHGLGGNREEALRIVDGNGHGTMQLQYISHEIYPGKKAIPGLPATFGTTADVETLEITAEDVLLHLKVILKYSVFEATDVVTRYVTIENCSEQTVTLTQVMSACIDMPNEQFDMITVHGNWAREGQIDRARIMHGTHSVESMCGKTSHDYQPFLAICSHNADQNRGEVYGLNMVYSGNFIARVTNSFPDQLRITMGIHPSDFRWILQPGDRFDTPEVVMTYTDCGIGQMTRNLHDQYRNHLIQGKYAHAKRPILLNNWEATYFDFDTQKLLRIAKQAAELGIEMLVVDDGWFGRRNDDNSSLGDWFVNEEKLPGGLKTLVDQVNALGLKFGLWFEPEMVSPDSDLYRAHPDYAIAVPGRRAGMARNQYVLDLGRSEVVECVYGMLKQVLSSANIEYVKWDMNRALCDLGSYGLPADRQGELLHRYVMGVYELQGRLLRDFPNLLLENCSSGGGRFDPGMLYYSPQIWTSDDTDGLERIQIQEGIAMIYPLSSMGAHVSDCPNHITGRTVPFETRGQVALAGTFGYELDVTRIPEADRNCIPSQVKMYHQYHELISEGDYYRLLSYSENHQVDAYMVVDKKREEALVSCIFVQNRPGDNSRRIKLQGLDPEKYYRIIGESREYSGEELMYIGLLADTPWAGGDYRGRLFHLQCR